MADRRPLTEGLKIQDLPVDPVAEKAFIYGAKAAIQPEAAAPPPAAQTVTAVISRVPISTRMRVDYATALKRASLERQLGGIAPNSLQDILEQAVEPWLRSNGYLK